MLRVSIVYTCKYQIKFNPSYVFTTCGLCINLKTNRIIKQVIKSNCIGYIIGGKFYSLTYLRKQLEPISKEIYPF
jgi:hypothetical protein